MKRPTIATLSLAERQKVIDTLKSCNYPYKDLLLETLDFVKILMEELKTGKISTNQLKQILLSLDPETLKKLTQIR